MSNSNRKPPEQKEQKEKTGMKRKLLFTDFGSNSGPAATSAMKKSPAFNLDPTGLKEGEVEEKIAKKIKPNEEPPADESKENKGPGRS